MSNGRFVNGDQVRITTGPAAGLTGITGATRVEDGKVEVIMPDLAGPASEAEEFYSESDLEPVVCGDVDPYTKGVCLLPQNPNHTHEVRFLSDDAPYFAGGQSHREERIASQNED